MVSLASLTFFLASLGAGLAFAILFRTPRRFLGPTVGLSLLAIYGDVWLTPIAPNGFRPFLVALGVSCLSQTFARLTRHPAQAFLIPGLTILLPGSHLYKGFSAILDSSIGDASREFGLVLASACSISFAVLLGNWLIPTKRDL